MPLLSGETPIAEIKRQYIENSQYDLTGGSVTRAEAFVQACRILQGMAKTAAKEGERFEFGTEQLAAQEQRALRWIDANSTANEDTGPGSVRFMDLSDFRQQA